MKKLFLIIFAGGLALSASAQRPFNHHDDIPGNRGAINKTSHRELDRRLAAIRAEYNDRIASVKHQAFMRNGERRRKIKELIRQRDYALDQCRNNFARSYASGFDRRHH